eukprot:snap_masked-scaffold_36-processed-gene-1.23-mRNA-1 protein AED:1.00 eAED:1.00 QI:0/-1/0/0/-1/1/1/0/121
MENKRKITDLTAEELSLAGLKRIKYMEHFSGLRAFELENERRLLKNKKEKKRRADMNSQFQLLAKILGLDVREVFKVDILKAAVDVLQAHTFNSRAACSDEGKEAKGERFCQTQPSSSSSC